MNNTLAILALHQHKLNTVTMTRAGLKPQLTPGVGWLLVCHQYQKLKRDRYLYQVAYWNAKLKACQKIAMEMSGEIRDLARRHNEGDPEAEIPLRLLIARQQYMAELAEQAGGELKKLASQDKHNQGEKQGSQRQGNEEQDKPGQPEATTEPEAAIKS